MRTTKLTDEARAMGRDVVAKRATAKATVYAPIILEIQDSGITTLAGLAAALNERGIPTARGQGNMAGGAG